MDLVVNVEVSMWQFESVNQIQESIVFIMVDAIYEDLAPLGVSGDIRYARCSNWTVEPDNSLIRCGNKQAVYWQFFNRLLP